jgi:aryl-alcohol dehydrogenase-like predicted oxidoreductase
MEPTHTALGTWSGGRFMRFGLELDDARLEALFRPGDGIDTVLTADTYGTGEADRLLGKALTGLDRDTYSLVGAIGHDFYAGERQGAKGFPRFTHPDLRTPAEYGEYLRTATEKQLERLGQDHLDLLLLHNPDRTGYTHEAVWEGMAAVKEQRLATQIGVAPGPANGFTLDLIDCLERFGAQIDWAMVILNPLEPWPGELVLDAAAQHDVKLITRVVDYGGLFHDDVLEGHPFPHHDHRTFRPQGWVEQGRAKLERMRPVAERHGLTMLQLACAWNLAHGPVHTVVPTLIEEPGGKPVETKRAELAATPNPSPLTDAEVQELRAIGDNTGCMALKGASLQHEGPDAPDRWAISDELAELGRRYGITPERDLALTH